MVFIKRSRTFFFHKMWFLFRAWLFAFYIFLLIITNVLFHVEGLPPEVSMNFEQRVKFHGYPVEIHKVITDDDYILHLYRIPHGMEKTKDEPKNKSVVFLVHGMGGAPYNFITLGKDHAPAYYFANRSFDVWLICTRGVDCQNPQKHTKYDWNRDSEYWNYSFHEIGLYDVPACIDYIIKVTGQEKIFYIGHSAGGPSFFVATIERPEYNNKIKMNINYGQGSLINNIDFPMVKLVMAFLTIFKNFIYSLGVQEFITRDIQSLVISLTRNACADPDYKKTCRYALVEQTVSNLMEAETAQIAFSTFSRISLRHIMHFVDNFEAGGFRKFDWGAKKNMKMYGQKTPPLYNMSACTARNVFFYGATDGFSTPQDNRLTMDLLTNTVYEEEIGPKFTHLDFIFSRNSTFMIYEKTVKLFREYDEGIMRPRIARRTTQ